MSSSSRGGGHGLRDKVARLMVGDSERQADMLYAARLFVPDPFVWLEWRGRTFLLLSPLEVDRARREAQVDEVVDQGEWERRLNRGHRKHSGQLPVLRAWLRELGVEAVQVPEWTAAGVVQFLRRHRVAVEIVSGLFFPEREIKRREEIRMIERAQRQAEAGMERAWQVLREARVGRGKILRWAGDVLSSERLRGEIDAAVVRAGGLPARTIVAGGVQGCDPHEVGHGPLRADEAIILDIFPRDQASGYFGDLTRTVVRGRAGEALRRQYETVLLAQEAVMRRMKAGADGTRLHEWVKATFQKKGYMTEVRDGRWVGFFHGTGHSLGLEIHEPPRFAAGRFRAGQVMTVEPGLYYPETGGVRIEDLVVIGRSGVKNLTRCAKFLEL